MLRIRLRRVGKKKQPMYRIVIADSRAPRDGRFVESIGYYHPLEEPTKVVLDEERARHWLDKGAQPSDRVSKILALQGIAEIPEKLKARMALGARRSSEASAKAEAEARAASAEASATAEATEEPAAQASDGEAPPEEEPKPEGEAEASSEASAPTEAAPAEQEPKPEADDEAPAQS